MSSTRYGRIAVAEPPSSLTRMHMHDGTELKPVIHEIPIPTLDQEDLENQGINVAELIPGAKEVDALGSCVANATTAALSAILPDARLDAIGITGNAVDDEEFAIRLYHELTMLTGNSSSEFPPEDCGSSGLYSCQYLEAHGIISGHKIAHGGESILSLLQEGPLIVGQPYLAAWEQPEAPGYFVDGDGSLETLYEQIKQGVAGGHETCVHGIDHIEYDEFGYLDPFKTTLIFRNSWGQWAAAGEAKIHLSTFVALGNYCDFRLLIA